jgi:hypothetical protein
MQTRLFASLFILVMTAFGYDLSSDWSNSANPNGPWAFSVGTTLLPLTANWNGANTGWPAACNQPALAPSNVAGGFLPAFLQVNACAVPFFPLDPNNPGARNVLAGDVVVHTNDASNGNLATGSATIVFTLPASNPPGPYNVTGALWKARLADAGDRPQDWQVMVNGALLTSGVVTPAVSRSRPQTFNFTQNLNAGDRVQLILSKDPASAAGDLVGVQLTVTPLTSVTPTKVLPQLAFGGGWYTALYFTNTAGSPASITVNFVGDNGNPLSIPSLGGSSATINLAARGTGLIEVPNAGDLSQGYILAAPPPGVTGYGVFRQSLPGVPDQEAVVPLSALTATLSTLLFDDTKYVTGVAIVNLGLVDTTITAAARGAQGNPIGTASISLPAKAKKAIVLRDLIPAVTGTMGAVDFTASIGNLAALGLRFNGTAFTSIPTTDR